MPSNNTLNQFLLDHPKFEQVEMLGRGGFSFVSKALNRETGEYLALKFIQRGPQINKYVEREIVNQLRLRHPHIIKLSEAFLTETHLVLVMEYAPGGDLARLLASKGQPFSEDEARWFFSQIAFAIDYCHRMGVANRDIKLQNTLLSDTTPRPLIKLADFGLSKDENYQSAPGSTVGTPAYAAPEVILKAHGEHYDAKKADIWSCGVLLFSLLTGQFPFQRLADLRLPAQQQAQAMLKRVALVDYELPQGLSPQCIDLITQLLVADPVRRPTMAEILRHPWVSEGMLPEVLNFNDSLVANSLASPPPQETVDSIRSLVAEAATLHPNEGLAAMRAFGQQVQQHQQGQRPVDLGHIVDDSFACCSLRSLDVDALRRGGGGSGGRAGG